MECYLSGRAATKDEFCDAKMAPRNFEFIIKNKIQNNLSIGTYYEKLEELAKNDVGVKEDVSDLATVIESITECINMADRNNTYGLCKKIKLLISKGSDPNKLYSRGGCVFESPLTVLVYN